MRVVDARLPVAIGEVLDGKYRVQRVVGRGGMGLVVAATHLHLEQPVALKFIVSERLDDPSTAERFLREARTVVRLKSQHVARVLDVARLAGGAPYIVMELLDGTDLAATLRAHGPLPIATAADYVIQACDALAEAHGLGIVHRDLKPSNLFLTTTAGGRTLVKVLDFGVSKVSSMAPGELASMTASGAMVGSPAYMSPEQMRAARDVDARSDIWALGVILFEMVTGAPPFRAENLADLCLMVISNPPPPVGPRGGGRFDAIVQRCLEKRPADRYPTVAELARDLAELAPPAARLLADNVAHVVARAPPALAAPGPARVADQARTVSLQETPPVRRPSRRSRLAAFAALPLVAGGVIFAVRELRRPDRVAAAPNEVDAAPPPLAAAADAAAPPSLAVAAGPDAAPDALEVELEIQVRPRGAEVFLDGKRLGVAPGIFRVGRAVHRKRLELRKPGYLTWATEVTPAKNLVVPVELERRRARTVDPDDLDKPEWGP
jgi:serine/threonine-protein kinase